MFGYQRTTNSKLHSSSSPYSSMPYNNNSSSIDWQGSRNWIATHPKTTSFIIFSLIITFFLYHREETISLHKINKTVCNFIPQDFANHVEKVQRLYDFLSEGDSLDPKQLSDQIVVIFISCNWYDFKKGTSIFTNSLSLTSRKFDDNWF